MQLEIVLTTRINTYNSDIIKGIQIYTLHNKYKEYYYNDGINWQ